MTPTPKAELSEKKYLPYRQDGGRIILAKIATMPLNVGGYYEIRPGKAWDGGRHCRIVSLHDGHAVCEVGKVDMRRSHRPVDWLKGTFEVPFDRFIDGPF